MNVFEAIKDEVTTRDAAVSYGINVRYNGMAVCPFHDDKNPSMKLGERYYCFGCQAKGDVIDFTSNLFGLKPKEAAEKLASDFNVRYDVGFHGKKSRSVKKSRAGPDISQKSAGSGALREYKVKERRCFIALCEYLHLLNRWKARYVPKTADEEWHPKFCEALNRLDYIEYLLDLLLYSGMDDRRAIVESVDMAGIEQKVTAYLSDTS